MKEKSILHLKSYQFALDVVDLYKICIRENHHYRDLFKQLIRSGTSIGANIHEASGSISKAEFSSKISIAYREALETRYWLSLLKDSEIISKEKSDELDKKADELCRIMFSVLKSTGRIKQSKTDDISPER